MLLSIFFISLLKMSLLTTLSHLLILSSQNSLTRWGKPLTGFEEFKVQDQWVKTDNTNTTEHRHYWKLTMSKGHLDQKKWGGGAQIRTHTIEITLKTKDWTI